MAVAAFFAVAAIFVTSARAAEESRGDAQAMAIVQKHCVLCHAVKPRHANFEQPPKSVTLETIAELKKHAKLVQQTLLNRTMPLGNLTGMSDGDRASLLAWLQALK